MEKNKKIDPRTLKGEALYVYFTEGYSNTEYSDIVELLPLATGSMDEAYVILERCVKDGKKLKAVYPAEENTNTSKYEFIGSIPDGELYLC